jgi:hypothetical protein
MSQPYPDFLDKPSGWRGEIGGPEIWWVEKQQALEQAGYMLRPRYRTWLEAIMAHDGKHRSNVEDGQSQSVSAGTFPQSARAHELSAARVHGRHSDL